MTRLICSDYGFECSYQVEGEDKEILEKFGKHSTERHWIEYSKGALKQILLRKHHRESPKSGIILNKQEIQTVICILDLVYSAHPMSFFEDLRIDHRMIQQMILKMSEGVK
ncbi:MAG: DUF1059 domain-containing protein [Rhabdochlamydiaceae bacterium]